MAGNSKRSMTSQQKQNARPIKVGRTIGDKRRRAQAEANRTGNTVTFRAGDRGSGKYEVVKPI